jgi:CRP-like cAMP-binding protein
MEIVDSQKTRPPGESHPVDDSEAESLAAFDQFGKFSQEEIRQLLRLMRRWDLEKGTTVFTEGSPGDNCFIILEGTVDVSVHTRGHQQLLATLNPGNVFGQMSLIDRVPRSATCSVRTDAMLLEILRDPCEELLNGRSALALKFLATLNEGLILALRGADLRLMQLRGTETRANL